MKIEKDSIINSVAISFTSRINKRSSVSFKLAVIPSAIEKPLHLLHVRSPVNLCVCKWTRFDGMLPNILPSK